MAIAIPPANIDATVTTLDTEKADIPLIPCPDVQPPASREPTIIVQPPKMALNAEISDELASMGRYFAVLKLPASIPAANIMAETLGAFPPLPLDEKICQNSSPASAYAVENANWLAGKKEARCLCQADQDASHHGMKVDRFGVHSAQDERNCNYGEAEDLVDQEDSIGL